MTCVYLILMDPQQQAIVVPYTALPDATLRAIVESFVLREGTDYGSREFTLAEKVAHVIQQLERGAAQIIFEPESQSVDIVQIEPATRGL